jgi:hypothetical protein
VYVASCLAVILAASLLAAERRFTVSVLLETLLAGFAVSAVLAHYVDHARSQVFSRFWHQSRHELREALQAARKSLRAAAGE